MTRERQRCDVGEYFFGQLEELLPPLSSTARGMLVDLPWTLHPPRPVTASIAGLTFAPEEHASRKAVALRRP